MTLEVLGPDGVSLGRVHWADGRLSFNVAVSMDLYDLLTRWAATGLDGLALTDAEFLPRAAEHLRRGGLFVTIEGA